MRLHPSRGLRWKTHSLGLGEDLFTLGESVSLCGGCAKGSGGAVSRRGREGGRTAEGKEKGGAGELHGDRGWIKGLKRKWQIELIEMHFILHSARVADEAKIL